MSNRYLSDVARARLRHVHVGPRPVDLSRFPDFLIIGPQRTGTTWIHENLRDHPDILWPREKEIFYFSRLKTPEHPKFVSADLDWYLAQFRDPVWLRAVKTVLSLRSSRSLYRPRVRGEATASYAAMDRDVIEEIVVLNPGIRAIMMIRNPIDRAWSHAKKDLVRNRGRRFEDVAEREFEEFFRDPYQLRCAQYGKNYDNWSSCLADGNLFVGKFDDVAVRPVQLLGEICRFLGVRDERRYLGRAVDRPVNPTGAEPIPERYRAVLSRLLAGELEEIERRFQLSWER
jgi:hypothetical protein